MTSHSQTLNFNTSNTQDISFANGFIGSNKQLVSVRIQRCVVTRDGKVIDSSNNTLYLKWDSESAVSVSLAVGDYDVTTLATELKAKLDASSLGGTWTVSYSPTSANFSITPGVAATQWSLYVTTGGPEDILGIAGTITVDGETRTGLQGTDSLTTDTEPDLSGEKFAYILLHKQGETNYTEIGCVETGNRINTLSSSHEDATVCIDPSSNYEVSIMRMKKNGSFSSFGLGPTNMVTLIYYT